MSFKKLDAYLDSFYSEKNIPGVGIAVYHRHKPVHEHYAGFADVENNIPFSRETLFNLYSATKISTCVCALQLIERGKLKLSDKLSDYIPEYADVVLKNADGEFVRPENDITIENLFTMSAGIPGGMNSDAVRELIEKTNRTASTLDIVKAMAKEPLMFQPGSHFKYGVCHDVLGGVIEVVSGMTLGEYMQKNVFAPIGMTDTSFRPDKDRMKKMAVHYVDFNASTGKSRAVSESFNLRPTTKYEMGGGGLVSSVRDYILLCETLCNNGTAPNGAEILSEISVCNMRKNRITGDMVEDFNSFGGWSKHGYGYGLGVRTLVDRERNNSLSENGEFGWDGACGCYAVIDPKAEIAIFYAQQEAGSRWWEWHGSIRNHVYASLWE